MQYESSSLCRLSHSCTLLKPSDRMRCHAAGTFMWSPVTLFWTGALVSTEKGDFGGQNPQFAAPKWPICRVGIKRCLLTPGFVLIKNEMVFYFVWQPLAGLVYKHTKYAE